jgi:hypothetical protein
MKNTAQHSECECEYNACKRKLQTQKSQTLHYTHSKLADASFQWNNGRKTNLTTACAYANANCPRLLKPSSLTEPKAERKVYLVHVGSNHIRRNEESGVDVHDTRCKIQMTRLVNTWLKDACNAIGESMPARLSSSLKEN